MIKKKEKEKKSSRDLQSLRFCWQKEKKGGGRGKKNAVLTASDICKPAPKRGKKKIEEGRNEKKK